MANVLEGMEDCELDLAEITLAEQVGYGRTATVHRAFYHDEVVAVKKITGDLRSMSTQMRKSLCRELEILKAMNHPKLVRLIGVTIHHPLLIVMEFCPGGTLFELLHHSDIELSWPQKSKMAVDIAEAMVYLHSHEPPILHRDLKSLNLLLAEKIRNDVDIPMVKLSDFGMSRLQDDTMTLGAGTSHWMAPEVFSNGVYDDKVDAYSYSIVLYEIICQDIPFSDLSEVTLRQKVVKGERPDLADVPDDCPQVLLEVMTACWEHDPRKRHDFNAIIMCYAEADLAIVYL
mmetsp:Transcript_44575/g.123511  ORF Transcript_44575/g.123511 Transcript_44575/m.123511 type:complete len:288 (+) Transcript_44575:108-971(+)|eukprot:CAMPEP_0117554280 /NCGR_PEP_ID=MMETSP0784-20121206/50672_1 /TAXON_ID=39447 /ORGANISM="" /LENGTH=287 /DNA_ID=CAMNT_0005351439 /DNA_START=103 /DNA_END=966 /DNA_ORIENTATION=-